MGKYVCCSQIFVILYLWNSHYFSVVKHLLVAFSKTRYHPGLLELAIACFTVSDFAGQTELCTWIWELWLMFKVIDKAIWWCWTEIPGTTAWYLGALKFDHHQPQSSILDPTTIPTTKKLFEGLDVIRSSLLFIWSNDALMCSEATPHLLGI